MSDINVTVIRDESRKIADEIAMSYPHVEVHIMAYEPGGKRDAVAKALASLKNHPSIEDAAALLRFRSSNSERSGLLGIAEGIESSHMGLKKTRHRMAFIAINLGECRTQDEAIFLLYKLTTQLIDQLSEKRKRHQAGESEEEKKNFIEVARQNLRADSFHVLSKSKAADHSFLDTRTHYRAMQVLEQVTNIRPEEYPLPIAQDVIRYALKNKSIKKDKMFGDDLLLATQIADSFDVHSLRTWAHFVTPCQTLAWGGYTPSQILGSAIFLSPNPMIKATGHLLAEITGVDPSDKSSLPKGFNPFLEDEINAIEHKRSIEQTFEIAMIHSLEADSHLPLLRIANNQNEALLKGHISGWCAHALQSAARAFQGADELGVPAAQAARLEFQTVRRDDCWLQLTQIVNYIVDLGRGGTEARTLSGLAKWCGMSPEFKHILNAINMTISDPHYSMKMRNDVEMPNLHITPLAPSTTLSGPLPPQFAKSLDMLPTIGLSIPGLGTTQTVVIHEPIKQHDDE
jgi:hypothetical protein